MTAAPDSARCPSCGRLTPTEACPVCGEDRSMPTDTFEAWLSTTKELHVEVDGRCRADGRTFPCHMRQLIDKAEAMDLLSAEMHRNLQAPWSGR